MAAAMTATQTVAVVAAVLLALALAWWPWRHSLDRPGSWFAAAGRFVGVLALVLLLLDPGIRATLRRRTPLVLLDNSVSMHAASGRADSAAALAAALGEVLPFAEAAPGEPGARTALGEPLAAAVAAGRPLVIVSDGEVADAATIPPDLLAQAAVRLLPRERGPDVAITDARLPARLAAGDTLAVEVDLLAGAGWRDSVRVEVRDDGRVLLAGHAGFDTERALLRLAGPLPDGVAGERWLEIAVVGVDDAEPADHLRWRRLVVTPSPGIVVLAERPDWDARFLYSTLGSVTAAPVRGFVQLRSGSWHRMDDLRPVSRAEVVAAARNADLLAVRGDTAAWSALARARLLWPAATTAGDWYLRPAGASPLSGALAGIAVDSLPALPVADAVSAPDWVALEAQQARRGAAIPVIVGREDEGRRTVIFAVDGLHRWAFRGGDAEQLWRALVAETASWLLGTPTRDDAIVAPVEAVVQRGRPLRFRHREGDAAVALGVTFQSADTTIADTLRFDAEGVAAVVLPPGRYRYRIASGPPAATSVAVEPYADELLFAPVTLHAAEAAVQPVPVRRSLRDLLPFFALAVLGLTVEWVMRRRLGMR